MADQPQPPLVPAEVDLRGMDFMPLKGEILFKSTTWLKASHEGRCAALRLWWHSFAHEVPAASLPDDDQLLSEHAGYGEVVKAWLKIKPQAMRGWVLCSDGRWYHKVVAALAMEAWEGRLKNRERVRKWREKKAGGNADGNGGGNEHSADPVRVTTRVRNGLKGESELQRQSQLQLIDSEAADSPAAARDTPPVDDPGPIPEFLRRVPTPDVATAAYAHWQEAAGIEGWPDVGFLNSHRRQQLLARLDQCGGIDGWKRAIEQARDADFLRMPDGTPQRWFDQIGRAHV